MLKDITLGQYFPGKSVIHRLDPRTKLIALVIYIAALFTAGGWIGYALCGGFLVFVVGISGIPAKSILRSLKPLWMIMLITFILNLFFFQGETVLVAIGALRLTVEGVVQAVQMCLRIILLITSTFLLTYTTSPIALTDGLESLLNPLKKIHVPVHELSMMMSIALRFIPTLIEETNKIMAAQKARGADFESGSLMERVRALIPILIPLFISAFRRAIELATAMECRCYHGGDGRTKMKLLRYGRHDLIAFGVCALLLGCVIGLGVLGL